MIMSCDIQRNMAHIFLVVTIFVFSGRGKELTKFILVLPLLSMLLSLNYILNSSWCLKSNQIES